MSKSPEKYDVVIVGGGMVGATLACELAQAGLKIALLEALTPSMEWDDTSYDLRVSALTLGSKQLFQRIGVWQHMQQRGVQPFQKMFVWDHAGAGELDIDSADAGEMDMGCVVENRVTVAALWDKLQSLPTATLYSPVKIADHQLDDAGVQVTLEDGRQISGALLVGADGANSMIRQLAGIESYGWEYQQKALVATVKPEHSHENTAWQRFLAEGPLALLPLRNGLISIVWTSETQTTDDLLALSDTEFCEQLAEASEYKLGSFSVLGPRAGFPLRMKFSNDYCKQRMALVGDAIHAIHPLAGQGVNLGLADVEVLANVVVAAHTKGRDIASEQVLRRYERQRKGDNLLMMSMMDGFKRLFVADDALLQFARNTGMAWINASALIKNQICKYAMGLRKP